MKTKNQILLQKIKDTNPEFKDMDLTPVIYPPGYWDETKSLVKKIFDLEKDEILSETNNPSTKPHI